MFQLLLFFSLCIPALEPQVFKTSHWTCLFGHPSRSAFFSMAPVQTAALKGCLLYFTLESVKSDPSHTGNCDWLVQKKPLNQVIFFFFLFNPMGWIEKKTEALRGEILDQQSDVKTAVYMLSYYADGELPAPEHTDRQTFQSYPLLPYTWVKYR